MTTLNKFLTDLLQYLFVVYIWQFGRQTTYPNEMIPALMNTTINNLLGINASDLESVSHTDTTCYVLPVIQSGQPIILTGQCDANIPVVQNFDVPRVRYLTFLIYYQVPFPVESLNAFFLLFFFLLFTQINNIYQGILIIT